MNKISLGKPVPNVKFQTMDGEKSFNDWKDKNIVLYFYPKDNTPGCTQESKDFRDSIKKFDKLNTVIIGISRDSVKSHCKFVEDHDLPFTLISRWR